MNTMKTIAGEKVYSTGAYPEVIFIVMSGQVSVDSIVKLEECH